MDKPPNKIDVTIKAIQYDNTDLSSVITFERSLSFLEACKFYPAAILWSAFVSIGPICFVILSEASATRVRSKSIAPRDCRPERARVRDDGCDSVHDQPRPSEHAGEIGLLLWGTGCVVLGLVVSESARDERQDV